MLTIFAMPKPFEGHNGTIPGKVWPRWSGYASAVHMRRVLHLASHPREVPAGFRRALNWPRVNRAFCEGHGVIHVGANTGAERELYESYGLPVFWVEPIPAVFAELTRNIAGLPRQRCANALVAAEDGREFTFHIANNHGESSSIFDLADHRDIWPEVEYVEDVKMSGVTLPTLLRLENLEPADYDVLVLDTQGSELLILRGARPLLNGFRYIRSEVADFESYVGCCKRNEMTEFLESNGFREWVVQPWPGRSNGGGRYYDILYRRVSTEP